MATTVSPPADRFSSKAADLLQNLALESQTKGPDDIPDPATARKPIVVTAKSKSYVQSTSPLHKDFMNPSACYLPNGYTPSAYYYAMVGLKMSGAGSQVMLIQMEVM